MVSGALRVALPARGPCGLVLVLRVVSWACAAESAFLVSGLPCALEISGLLCFGMCGRRPLAAFLLHLQTLLSGGRQWTQACPVRLNEKAEGGAGGIRGSPVQDACGRSVTEAEGTEGEIGRAHV